MKKLFVTILLIVVLLPTFSLRSELKQRKITVTKTIVNKSTNDSTISDSTFVTDCVLGDIISIEYVKLYNGSKTYINRGDEFEEKYVAKLKK